ncbi:MAG: putative heme transporter, partial [Gaiellales bacterium]|nr:putative heme transporter [Gaiellales bacterium]
DAPAALVTFRGRVPLVTPPVQSEGQPGAPVGALEGGSAAPFAAPPWLRNLGTACWMVLGVVGLLAVLFWLLGTASAIVTPVIAGGVIAAVASPVVAALQRRGLHRGLGALVVLLGIVSIGVVVLLLVVGGIVAQRDSIEQNAGAAATTAESWLEDAGVDPAGRESAAANVKTSVPDIISTFVSGVITGVQGVTSLAFGLSFAVFAVFFLLKDGPVMRAWIERHLGLPPPVARLITGEVLTSLRRYFGGVTIVAAFNGVLVMLGAWLLGVPLAGSIGVVTFVTAYIPFVGAFVAGAFAVVIALGAEGTTTAALMLIIVLLANGGLQNIVQPIAFGATLKLNPLVVLVVTIAAGSLFGMMGLVLAAPLTSAAVRLGGQLAAMRMPETGDATPDRSVDA